MALHAFSICYCITRLWPHTEVLVGTWDSFLTLSPTVLLNPQMRSTWTWPSITFTSLLNIKLVSSNLCMMTHSCMPLQRWCWMDGLRSLKMSPTHSDSTRPIVTYLQFRMESSSMEKSLLFHHHWKEVLCMTHKGHQSITKCQMWALNCVYWLVMNIDIQVSIDIWKACQCHCPKQPCQLLQLTTTAE